MAALYVLGLIAVALPGNADAPAQAATAQPAEPADALPTIIVTARRRAEDAQDVPGALSVIGGERLDRSATVNTALLSQLVPSLNYSSANPRNTAFTIRGLGSSVVAVSQANDGLEPGVGYYVDQVYHARPATAAFDFSDIERIEILRGPQGTLFGKNSTAGAISIHSRLPSFEWAATGELSAGRFDFVQARIAATGPLASDSIAFRIAGLITRRDGVIRNVASGARHNGVGNQALRGQLLIKPAEAVRLRLIADFANFESNCCTQVPIRVGTSLRPASRQYPALAAGLGYAPPSFDPYDRVTDIDAPLAVETSEGGVSAIADWEAGAITLTSVSAWRFWNWDAANDRDYLGLPIQRVQHIPSRQDQYSQELRLASDGERRLSYVAGLYAFRQTIRGRPISIYGPLAAYWLIGPTTGAGATPVPGNLLDGYRTDGRTRFVTNSYAAFGEANFRLTDRLTLTGGLRYTYETKQGDYDSRVFGGLETANAALINAKLSILRPQSYSASDKDGSLSGRANLALRLAAGWLGYASVARGYKSGGINMSGLPLDAQNQPVLATAVIDPERNTTWEAGIKSRLFDRRLTVNLAAFHTVVRDFQATVVDSSQTVALRGYLSNVPEVTVKGFEADAAARMSADFSLRGSVAFADGRYTDYPAGPCPLERQTAATAACDLGGQRLSGLPRWSIGIGGDYAAALPRWRGKAFVSGNSSWRTGYNGDPSLSRFTYIDGYNVTNARLGFRSDQGWEVAIFARNLLNRDYIQNLTIQAGNSGLILGTPSEPRIIGLSIRVGR